MPEGPSTALNNLLREYCYTVQVFKAEDDPTPSWAGTYGVNPSIRQGGSAGDGGSVRAGLGKEGRITGGCVNATSEGSAIEALNVMYGTPGVNYRLLSLEARGVIGLGESG